MSQAIDMESNNNNVIPHNINIDKIKRDSIIHSPGMGGVSWGSRRISTWLRNDSIFHITLNEASNKNNQRKSISLNKRNSLIDINGNRVSLNNYNDTNLELEKQFCKDYSCCGLSLPDLHDLLTHYKEHHLNVNSNDSYNNNHNQSHQASLNEQQMSFNQFPSNHYDHQNVIDSISTNEIFLDMNPKLDDQGNSSIAPLTPDSLKPETSQLSNNNTSNNNNMKDTIQFNNPFASRMESQPNHQKTEDDFDEDDDNDDGDEEDEDEEDEHDEDYDNSNNIQNNNENLNLNISYNLPNIHHDLTELHLDSSNSNQQSASQQISGNFMEDPARHLYIMDTQRDTPFKCPVIGCNKCYKNQNGLKYHKIHGHKHQKLQNNSDGTVTVLDPITNQPLYHNSDFEKDKPYHCEVCGKRYKNLNGLKYHRGHTTH